MLGDERLTYAAADARSAALAKGLLVSGVGKSTPVALLAPNGPAWVVAWLAAARIGAVVALLNTYGKTRELGRALRHADVAHLLTVGSHLGHDYLARLEEAAPGLADQRHEHLLLPSHPYLRSVWTWGGAGAGARPWCGPVDDLVARGAAVPDEILAEVEAEVRPSDPMIMVFSSGSTADPKAVVHSHGATVRHAHNLNQQRDLRPDDVIYTPMPLFWVGGLSFSLVAAMHAGASPGLRGAVRARRDAGAARARAGDPGARVAPHGQGARRPPVAGASATCPRSARAPPPRCRHPPTACRPDRVPPRSA